MRQITFEAMEYNFFIYPMMLVASLADNAEYETALRLLRLLRDETLTVHVPPTEEEQEAERRNPRTRALSTRKLREDRATFELEEAEWSMLVKHLERIKTTIPLVALEDYDRLLTKMKEAKEMKKATGIAGAE